MNEPRLNEANRGRDPAPEEGISEVEAAVEGVPAAVSLTPGSAVPALGGELILGAGGTGAAGGPSAPAASPESLRAGFLQAGPLAIAGIAANAAGVVVTVLLARLLTTRGYGALAQLTGLFLIISMPGSAVIVGVVRRVTARQGEGSAHLVQRWAYHLHRRGAVALVMFALVIFAIRDWIARELSLPNAFGVVAILVAGGVWILLCLDRGLLQAHRSYRPLAINLLVEAGIRTVAMLVLVAAGLGVAGAAFGLLFAELCTAVHARVEADRAWGAEVRAEVARGETGPLASGGDAVNGRGPEHAPRAMMATIRRHLRPLRRDLSVRAPATERRVMVVDLVTALLAMAMLALLQNVDVIVLGREAPHASGAYAAISVTAKALVFGAIVLGGYLLPEAAIRWRQGGHALRQVAVTLVLLGIPAAGLLVVALAAPRLLLSTVFSSRYLGAASSLAPLVAAMVALSITVILTMYLLAVGKRWVAIVLVAGGAAATAAVAAAHGVPHVTARADLAVQAALATVVVVFAWVHRRRSTTAHASTEGPA